MANYMKTTKDHHASSLWPEKNCISTVYQWMKALTFKCGVRKKGLKTNKR